MSYRTGPPCADEGVGQGMKKLRGMNWKQILRLVLFGAATALVFAMSKYAGLLIGQ
jgi:hypothetical protein